VKESDHLPVFGYLDVRALDVVQNGLIGGLHRDLSGGRQTRVSKLFDDFEEPGFRRLGVGVTVAYKPYRFENWDVLAEPEPHEPSPDLLDGFLEAQLLPEVQEEIEKWLSFELRAR
jgi:hypothetical protein